MPNTAIVADGKMFKEIMEKTTGCRMPGGMQNLFFLFIPIAWSLFQLWIISPLPFYFGVGLFNDTESRAIHLAFAVFLAFTGFPMLKHSPQNKIPLYDWFLSLLAAGCALYLVIFLEDMATRSGRPTREDVIVACLGVLLLLEATRRVMGLPMTIVASIFLVYAFAGPYAPDIIAHKGASLNRAASHFWLTQEGVFGIPLGVSTSVVFLYVLFGAMLEHSGAGNYLTSLAFSLLGRFRGGPAKAAVVASGLHGLISGSSIANVLTCGPVTIMLMKKVGFTPEKAGAIEVAAGSNGQIMPPVMGAAAFLMIEYINMPYSQLIKHAFIPAILAYASLLYIVHLEACKMGMKAIRRDTPLKMKLIGWGLTITSLIIIVSVIYFLLSFIPWLFGAYAWTAFAALLAALYFGMIFISTKVPELPEQQGDNLMHLPSVLPTLCSGLHFLLPIATLVWCLMVMEMSAGLAAFYACVLMSFILLTHRPLVAMLRRRPVKPAFQSGLTRLIRSLIGGGRNMVGIGLATASAGIVVGVVSLTGVGQVLAGVVETISMGYLPLVLIMTAVLSLVLGMGLPTTANYIIVSTLLAPVIYNLSAAHGLDIPLIAVHLFCLYFGIMADATPPVALAAFAASGISGGDPLKTGVQGFLYEMRTAILPFVFLYNQEILLMNIGSWPHLIWVLTTSWFACMAFASVTQRFMLTRTTLWETALLIIAIVFMFRPDIPRDYMYAPYSLVPPEHVLEEVAKIKPGDNMRLAVRSDDGKKVRNTVIVLPVSAEAAGLNAVQRLEEVGLEVEMRGQDMIIANIGIKSRAEDLGLDAIDENSVTGLQLPAAQPPKELFAVPGLLCFAIVALNQYRKRKAEKALEAAEGASPVAA